MELSMEILAYNLRHIYFPVTECGKVLCTVLYFFNNDTQVKIVPNLFVNIAHQKKQQKYNKVQLLFYLDKEDSTIKGESASPDII